MRQSYQVSSAVAVIRAAGIALASYAGFMPTLLYSRTGMKQQRIVVRLECGAWHEGCFLCEKDANDAFQQERNARWWHDGCLTCEKDAKSFPL
jgi:hypothetical protein